MRRYLTYTILIPMVILTLFISFGGFIFESFEDRLLAQVGLTALLVSQVISLAKERIPAPYLVCLAVFSIPVFFLDANIIRFFGFFSWVSGFVIIKKCKT